MVFSAEGARRDLAPVPASTVVLLRPGPAAPEVFLLRRSGKSTFFGGAFVFPGGKVDAADGGLLGEVPAGGPTFQKLSGGAAEDSGASYVAAARELFEEAGVFLGHPGALQEEDRVRVHRGELSFEDLLRQRGARLELERLVPFAHWVTPSAERRRFDTRFFVALLPEEQVASSDRTETTVGVWHTARAALGRHHRGEVFLPPPTQRVLEELVGPPLEAPGEVLERLRGRPLHPVLPRLRPLDGGVEIHLSHSPDYAQLEGEGLLQPEDAPERGFPPVIRVPPEAPPPQEAPAQAIEVLEFWFGADLALARAPDEVQARWWKPDPHFDAEIEARFGALVATASERGLEEWSATPEGSLACVILVDQFRRNLYRGDPRAFEFDPLAVEWALDAIGRGDDQRLSPMLRAFFYLPLMHAEDSGLQARCELAFERLNAEHGGFDASLEAARTHRAAIERFGRFPYRNEVLGRASSEEELAWLGTQP